MARHEGFTPTRLHDLSDNAHKPRPQIAELQWEPSVNAARIGVEVKDGRITLTGKVNWQYQRQSATDAVRAMLCSRQPIRATGRDAGAKPKLKRRPAR